MQRQQHPTITGPRVNFRIAGWENAARAARSGSAAHALDQALDPGVLGEERVLAQHGSLGLVVELEVHPVDGEVTTVLLGGPDEVAAQLGAGGLRRAHLGLEDLRVGDDPRDQATPLEQVEQPSASVDVVVGEVDLGQPRGSRSSPCLVA